MYVYLLLVMPWWTYEACNLLTKPRPRPVENPVSVHDDDSHLNNILILGDCVGT